MNESHDLVNREVPLLGKARDCHLLWIDKESATFAHFGYTEDVMNKAFQAFLHLKAL